MNNNDVDYAYLLHPPKMRGEGDVMETGAAAYRAWFRALLCENAETCERLTRQEEHIEWMREQVRVEDVA